MQPLALRRSPLTQAKMTKERQLKPFLDYVTQYAPDFVNRIQGASTQQINELERLAGRLLPESHRDFLAHMGEDDGGLNLTFDGTTKIGEILEYYRDEVITGNYPLPPNTILLGIGGVSISEIVLDCSSPGDPPVMFTDGDETAGVFAGSLKALLYNTAFNKFRLAQFPFEAFYSCSYDDTGHTDLTKLMPDVAHECGLTTLWFSDQVSCCAEKSDAGFSLTQYHHQGVSARIAATDRSEVLRIGAIVTRRLGVHCVE